MSIHAGQRVVCIRSDFPAWAVLAGTALPQKGSVYTVREVSPFSLFTLVRLVEIINPPAAYRNDDTGEMVEAAFPAHIFRPVVERKTDISVFTAMLNSSKVRA